MILSSSTNTQDTSMEDMFANSDPFDPQMQTVEDWVMGRVEEWRTHYSQNYERKDDEYYRLWRGIWAAEDKTRDSERSRIIAPALQQAVESAVSEVEEGTFGRGKFFDMRDDRNDPEQQDIVEQRDLLYEDLSRCAVRKACSEVLINAAVTGTGIAELVLSDEKVGAPASRPVDGGLVAVGVEETTQTYVKWVPIKPNNFLIDPVATSIEGAMGVAIDMYVPRHSIVQLQEAGVYAEGYIGPAASQNELEADKELSTQPQDKVRLTKYYGLVPSELLKGEKNVVSLSGAKRDEKKKDESYYTEAIVIIANGGIVLKAERSPYMMQDRPVVAFQWDVVPSRFRGRGVCEKGYNSQKALDAEMRARIDALALIVHPMMAVNANNIPRGVKPVIRPGKTLLTNGSPSETLMPFNFGNLSNIDYRQAAELQNMVQQATGAIDTAGMAGNINGEATAAGISMSLGAIIKRHKRTLLNFHEGFLIPAIEKTAWRYMQFVPERYRAKDYKFNITSTLGIITREYEVGQLVQLLQTTQPNSPLYGALTMAIVENMSLSNREELLGTMEKAMQPSPEQQQAQQAEEQRKQEVHQVQLKAMMSAADKDAAQAEKARMETQVIPFEQETRRIDAVTEGMDSNEGDSAEFDRRMAILDKQLKGREVRVKEMDAHTRRQSQQASRATEIESALLRKLGLEDDSAE
jgi:hypothetical protein